MATPPSLLRDGTWHLLGIGGIGVSGVARLLHARGLTVQGSDVRESQLTRQLRALGIRVFIGHDPRHLDGVDTVVVSTAIPASNPELVAAHSRGLRILHRSEALGALLDDRRAIGVIGTHGKGTVSAAIAWLLDQAGWEPGYVIGGLLENWGDNARDGGRGPDGARWLVAEVDESDGSLVNSQPEIAVLNNLELDHLHYYPAWPKLEAAVLAFFDGNPRLQIAVLNSDDAGVRRILARLDGLRYHVRAAVDAPHPAGVRLVTFGFEDGLADVRGTNLRCQRMAARFGVEMRGPDGTHVALGEVEVRLPGRYNASNVLGAIATALAAGVPWLRVQAAVPGYRGLENRFTLVDAAGVEVVKDYISHPTGIKRVLEAARSQAEGSVVAVFKPYRFTMIHYLQDDYREAFRDADRVVVTELYTAGEVPIPGIDTDFLCRKIRETGRDVHYVHDLADIAPWLQREVHAPATVLFFGGDDLFQVADRYVALRRGAEATAAAM
ncbi:MAG: UDP-N-acetylmuramate--L-alanine ligase [Myxococcales bacterium]|nr:UDP-N-acetylmuramate--L-alanine ligase [Myxococcales bacterium]